MESEESDRKNARFSLRSRLKSFKSAFSGIGRLLADEHNFRIHVTVFMIVIAAGIFLRISTAEWLAVIIVSGMVLTAESFNTAVESLSDAFTRAENQGIRKAKDTAAAGVLISSVIAAITGIVIFLPRIISLLY